MAVTSTERVRLRLVFGLFGCVPVFLAGWLAWLQIFQKGELRHASGAPLRLSPATADMQRDRRDLLPSPRGTIVDRHGATLAIDCEAFDVRAEIRPPRKALKDCKELRLYLADLAEKLSFALILSLLCLLCLFTLVLKVPLLLYLQSWVIVQGRVLKDCQGLFAPQINPKWF